MMKRDFVIQAANKAAVTIVLFIFLTSSVLYAAAPFLEADGPGGTYALIESKGYGYEVPDCGHAVEHISELWDTALNKNVFIFSIHRDLDDDRCTLFDRQRNEIKTSEASDYQMYATYGEVHVYKWKFKLDAAFQPSPNFCHVHQIKAAGGTLDSSPIITLTPRSGSPEIMQLLFDPDDNGASQVASANLSLFKGQWVQVRERILNSNPGTYQIEIKNVSTGAILLTYTNTNLAMWRTGANINRPKWGIYRSLANISYLRDEDVRFADFCLEEEVSPLYIENKASGKRLHALGTDVDMAAGTSTDNYAKWNPTNTEYGTTTFHLDSIGITTTNTRMYANSTGSDVLLSGNTLTDNTTRWSLISTGDGWYRMQHTSSGKWLYTNGSVVSLVATTDTSDNTKWRTVNASSPDTIGPAAPMNLAATAGDASVSLRWNDNAEWDVHYHVYRSSTSGGGYTQIPGDVSASKYTDSTVANGATYYYVVRAADTAGNESFGSSNQVLASPIGVSPIDTSTPKDQVLTVGSNVIFEVVPVAGPTILSYQWYEVVGSNNLPIGNNSPLLIIPTAQTSDLGRTFFCSIATSTGSFWSSQAKIINTSGGMNGKLVDNFTGRTESATIDNLTCNGILGGTWDTESETTGNIVTKTVDGSMTLLISGNSGGTSARGGGVSDLTNPITNTETGVLFFRFKVDTGTKPIRQYLGMHHYTGSAFLTGTTCQGTAVTAGFGVTSVAAGSTFDIVTTNNVTTLKAGLARNQWYNAWIVANNATDTFDLYVNTATGPGGAVESPSDSNRVTPEGGCAFGIATTSPLTGAMFLAPIAPGNTPLDSVRIDDIYWDGDKGLTVVPNVAPAAPQNLTAVGGYGYITLDWADNAEPDFSSYVLYRSTTSGTGYTRVTAGLTGSSYTDTGLDLQTRYYYVVRAENTGGTLSGFSGESSALPRLPGDLNTSGKVDLQDFILLAKDWGKTSGTYTGDISGPSGIWDGNVDIYDLITLSEDWLQ
jgi:hypothetical protein